MGHRIYIRVDKPPHEGAIRGQDVHVFTEDGVPLDGVVSVSISCAGRAEPVLTTLVFNNIAAEVAATLILTRTKES